MRNTYPFWFFVFVLIAFHLFAYIGHYGYDDLYYAKLANSLLNGQIDFSDHYSYRWTTLAYLALFFKVFGVGDFAAALSALSISIATLWISYLLVKQQSKTIVFFTLSLQLLGSWYLFYTDKITPDIYVLFFATLSVYFLVQQKFNFKKSYTFINASGLALAMMLGFLSKETIVLLVPALLFFAICDWVQKQNRVFWLTSLLIAVGLFTSYFYLINKLTGNVWARFGAIQANAYYNLCSYDVQDVIFTIRRVGYQFPELFIQTGLAIPLAFLMSAISRRKVAFLKPVTPEEFYIVLSIWMLLSGNFMSTSYKAYSPICLDIRHFLWIMPVLASVAGLGLKNYLSSGESDFSIARWLFILCIAAYYFGSEFTFTLYLPFTLLWWWHGWFRQTKPAGYFIVLLLISQLQPVYHWIAYAQGLKYEEQKKSVLHVLQKYTADTMVTDEVQKNLIAYYNSFDTARYSKVITFDDVKGEAYTGKVIYSNWYTQTLSGMRTEDLPLWMRLTGKSKHLIYKDSSIHVEAFKFSEPYHSMLIFKDSFSYEMTGVFWSYDSLRITKSGNQGNFCEQPGAYSATFTLPFDSLALNAGGQLIIRAKVNCKMKDKAAVKLVIDINDNGNTLAWKGEDCNNFMKAYGLWWPVTNELILEGTTYFNKHPVIKVYVWMNSPTALYIDDWVIEVLEIQ